MWFRYNGQEHKALNPIHIKRLLEDGAVEIEDPTAQAASQESEQSTEPLENADGSTEQESQDEPPVGDPDETVETNGKKPKRSAKA